MTIARRSFCLSLISATGMVALAMPVRAQVIPDVTLGNERSTVTSDMIIRDDMADLVEGGARRGANLFHSFSEFNVDTTQRVYFANPDGVGFILNRVTGNEGSNIFGTLGVDGPADLFFINPNGIVFGEQAILDVEGSFYATTENAIALGSGIYSATSPEQSQLLTVPPSVLFGRYLTDHSGTLESRGQLAAQENLALVANTLDLQGQVAAGDNLTLLAEAVKIRDTTAVPFIGFAGGDLQVQGNEQVDIVALNHPDSGLYAHGTMVLRSANPVGGDAHYWSGGNLRVETLEGELGSLTSPVDPIIRTLGDVEIDRYQGASLHILAGGAVRIGTVVITAADAGTLAVDFLRENIILSDGTVVQVDGGAQPTLDIRAGVAPAALGTPPLRLLTGFNNNTADVFFNSFSTDIPSSANIEVGDVFVNAANGLVLLTNQYQPNSALTGSIAVTGNGLLGFGISAGGVATFGNQGGSVYLDSRQHVTVTNSLIQTSGAGKVGNIVINAGDTVRLVGGNRLTGMISSLFRDENGQGGDIRITAGTLEVLNGAQLSASTFGTGDAGNVIINVRGGVRFISSSNNGAPSTGSAAFSNVAENAVGNGGNVEITAGSLLVANGAQLTSATQGIGHAGNVIINVRDAVRFTGTSANGEFISAASSRVDRGATGRGGNVIITADTLDVLNGGQLQAGTLGRGDAGNVIVNARGAVRFAGTSVIGQLPSAAFSRVEQGAIGRGGNVIITADTLDVLNGGQLQAGTVGRGDAGNVMLTARDRITLNNGFILSSIAQNAEGRGGNIQITARTLQVLNGAQLLSNTQGRGDAGNIMINVHDGVWFVGTSTDGQLPSAASSRVDRGAIGKGGDVTITAETLAVLNGAQLQAATQGMGDSGNVTITARDHIILDNGDVFSIVDETASGDGGNVEITVGTLELLNGAQLLADTRGMGNAGRVTITARESTVLQGTGAAGRPSAILTRNTSSSTGQGNDMSIVTPLLIIQDGAALLADTNNTQTGGDIILDLNRLLVLSGGQIASSSQAGGAAGNIRLDATDGVLIAGRDPNFNNRVAILPLTAEVFRPQSSLSVRSSANGTAGNIIIGAANTTPILAFDDGGQIIAESASTNGGNISLNLNTLLFLRSGSLISATAGTALAPGNGGNITINSPFIVAIPNENSDIAADAFQGSGGNVSITARGIFGIEPRPERTPLSDITASSELGISGTVNLATLNTDAIENNLTELDDTLIDPSALTAGSCIALSTHTNQGSFIVTGADGVSAGPDNARQSTFPTGTVQARLPETATILPEPNVLHQLADGRLILSRRC